MNLKKLYRKLFISGDWQMAYRHTSSHWPFEYNIPFTLIPNNKLYWFADPFLFESKGKIYLFCEAFNKCKQIGELAVMEYLGHDQWTDPKIIIANNYHMSYPCVFQYEDKYYMIPETTECGNLELYVADDFPYGWSKFCNLLTDVHLADPTIFYVNDILYLFAYTETTDNYIGHIFKIDLEEQQCVEIQSVVYQYNCGRPAGYMFKVDNFFIRPVQDSRNIYGESIIWNKFNFTDFGIQDIIIDKLDNSKVNIITERGEKRIHTFTACKELEVIDYNVFRFDLFKRFKILNRSIKQIQRKKRY